jgi:hypothetical protein
VNEWGKARVEFSADEKKLVEQRVEQACSMFMYCCCGAGIDAKPSIPVVLTEFKTWFDYEKVEEVFKDEL